MMCPLHSPTLEGLNTKKLQLNHGAQWTLVRKTVRIRPLSNGSAIQGTKKC
jgi:hypothetical protein